MRPPSLAFVDQGRHAGIPLRVIGFCVTKDIQPDRLIPRINSLGVMVLYHWTIRCRTGAHLCARPRSLAFVDQGRHAGLPLPVIGFCVTKDIQPDRLIPRINSLGVMVLYHWTIHCRGAPMCAPWFSFGGTTLPGQTRRSAPTRDWFPCYAGCLDPRPTWPGCPQCTAGSGAGHLRSGLCVRNNSLAIAYQQRASNQTS